MKPLRIQAGFNDKRQIVVSVVGGPRPYVWIGPDKEGPCIATMEPRQVEALIRRWRKVAPNDRQ